MKKRRGLRRYYRNLENQSCFGKLNFSCDENSWFDLFHFHIDHLGLGNDSWKSRQQHLDALFRIAAKMEAQLLNYSKDFQYWIEINEKDSTEDSIYIHTENPNETKFPIVINESCLSCQSTKFTEYLSGFGYQIRSKTVIGFDSQEETVYFLTRSDLGIGIYFDAK